MSHQNARPRRGAARSVPLALALGAALAVPPAHAEEAIKVLGPPGLAAAGGPALLQDYGSFALYRLSAEAQRRLPPALAGELRPIPEADSLRLAAATFNTQRQSPWVPAELAAADPRAPGLTLVQFVGPIADPWLELLAKSGVEVVSYIPENAYLVWADAPARAALSELAQTGNPVQWTGPYHPFYKLEPSLAQRALDPAERSAPIPLTVGLYAGGNAQRAAEWLAGRSLAPVSSFTLTPGELYIEALLPAADLVALARLPEVVWIEERREAELFDEVQAQVVAGNLDGAQSGPSGTGYLAWLTALGFSTDPADYPILDLIDTGIGNGSTLSGDPTFHELGVITQPSRIAYLRSCVPSGDGGDPRGHGHLDASVAAGYDVRATAPFQDEQGFRRTLGVNPYGRLAGTQVFGPTGGIVLTNCGGSYSDLLASVYNDGGRIANASWGSGSSYNTVARAFDLGVRDALPEVAGNQQLAVVAAVGNSGPTTGVIGSPAQAKNVLSVGASENDRPGFTDPCAFPTTSADNAMDLPSFSGRGPAAGGRTKPDLVAPGTHIQGSKSTHPNYNGFGTCSGDFPAKFYPAGQTEVTISDGTSQAAPAVAGALTLLDHWLGVHFGLDAPSPALLKAYLIAHTTYLTGNNAGDTLPSFSQGYGLPDLGAAFASFPRTVSDQQLVFDITGAEQEITGVVATTAEPLRVVLAYTDAAGVANSSSPAVNNLDLEVEVGGTLYRGNHFAGAWSIAGGTADAVNNVEAVYLPSGTSGPLTVRVRAANLAGDGVPGVGDATDQDFALVCSNCVLSLTEVWVDFTYSGPEAGTFSQPFNTLAEGAAAVLAGGQVKIKAGTTNETPTITKAMTLNAVGGQVRVGG